MGRPIMGHTLLPVNHPLHIAIQLGTLLLATMLAIMVMATIAV